MKRAYRRKYHYIYKTTCKVTGRYYIGMHSTDDLDDGYVGSGKRLAYSIGKHGIENHVCEILEHYFTREWLREREAELVCAETLTDPMCMNLKLGGDGGWDYINSIRIDGATKSNARQAELKATDPEWRDRVHAVRRQNLIDGSRHNTFGANAELHQVAIAKANAPEAMQKRKATYDAIGHQRGAKNSQHGTCWIHSITEKRSMKIAKSDLDSHLSAGWLVGRKMKF